MKAENMMKDKQGMGMTVKCPHTDPKEAPFRFQVGSIHETGPACVLIISLPLQT